MLTSSVVAEKTFRDFRESAEKNPSIKYIAMSHSDEQSTQNWLKGVGGAGDVQVIVDYERGTYSAWGLGTSSFWHVLSPGGLKALYDLGNKTGIWNRPTESGNRWQTAGNWAVDGDGIVRWGKINERADDIPDFEELVKSVTSKQ